MKINNLQNVFIHSFGSVNESKMMKYYILQTSNQGMGSFVAEYNKNLPIIKVDNWFLEKNLLRNYF